jgi:hypothetical protein
MPTRFFRIHEHVLYMLVAVSLVLVVADNLLEEDLDCLSDVSLDSGEDARDILRGVSVVRRQGREHLSHQCGLALDTLVGL